MWGYPQTPVSSPSQTLLGCLTFEPRKEGGRGLGLGLQPPLWLSLSLLQRSAPDHIPQAVYEILVAHGYNPNSSAWADTMLVHLYEPA